MAGFPGNPRRLGAAGIPPAGAAPVITETTNLGTDTFYAMGIAFAESDSPNGASGPPVRIVGTTNNGSDTFYVIGMVMAESGSAGSSGGTFRITETGTAGSDTYYVIGIVFSEN